MRWIPAKAKMGQAAPEAAPMPVPQPVPETKTGVIDKVIFGGLILAGAAAFITFVFGSQD